MRLPRALLDSLVILAGTSSAFAQTAEVPSELVLGPVVFIASNVQDTEMILITFEDPELGPVVPIASSAEGIAEATQPSPLNFSREEIQYLPGVEASPNPYYGRVPIKVIGHGGAAPIETVTACLPSGQDGVCHPDQIQVHFSNLAEQLAAAGLAEEAEQIQELQKAFQDEHYQRLLIAFKESQLRKLQAEIEGLKQDELNRSQIALRLQIIELKPEGRQSVVRKLQDFGSRSAITDSERELACEFLELNDHKLAEFNQLLEQLAVDGCAKIVAQPSATTLSGRNVRFLTGSGEFAVRAGNEPQMSADDGKPSFIGSGILVKPQILGAHKIRVAMILQEQKDVPSAINLGTISEKLQTTRLETVTEITSGQSVALVTPEQHNSANDQQKQTSNLLFVITPEIVVVPRQTQNPVASPAIYAPRPAAVEAKFIKKASSTRE